MAVQTEEEARRREPLTGATAIPRVDYVGESHCASPNTSGVFTLPKQCWQLSTMKRSGQLGWPGGTARSPHLRRATSSRRIALIFVNTKFDFTVSQKSAVFVNIIFRELVYSLSNKPCFFDFSKIEGFYFFCDSFKFGL